MNRRIGVTFEEVANAAEELVKAGESPTIDKIRCILGDTGSFTTISKYLNAWRRGITIPVIDTPKITPPDMVQAAVDHVWQQIHEQADTKIEAAKQEAFQLVQQAEEKTLKFENELSELINNYSTLDQSYKSLSAEKEILTLDLKTLKEESLLMTERHKALEKRYADLQTLTSQHLKDLSETHKNELIRLDEKTTKLIDEIKSHHQSDLHKQMALIDSINTENKKNRKKIEELEKEISSKNTDIAKLASTNKSLMLENLLSRIYEK